MVPQETQVTPTMKALARTLQSIAIHQRYGQRKFVAALALSAFKLAGQVTQEARS
jgi:hypothetical protein